MVGAPGAQRPKKRSRNISISYRLNADRLRSSLAPVLAVGVGWVLIVARITNAAITYAETQFYGLEAFFNATDGEQWTTSSGWPNSTLGVCGWYGVTCDNDSGNVTALSLAGNGLSGNLTAEAVELALFFEITSLKDMDLSNNQLIGPISVGLGMMPGLEVLDLSWNSFSSFPDAWGSGATSLQQLSLQFNNISGYSI